MFHLAEMAVASGVLVGAYDGGVDADGPFGVAAVGVQPEPLASLVDRPVADVCGRGLKRL